MPDIRRTAAAALVLNATYEPLCVVSVRRAAILILSAKAICVADGDGVLHSARNSLPVPSVVRLTRYVRVPYRTHVGLGDRTPAELGWRLHAAPAAPKGSAWRVLGHRAPDPRWADWLDVELSAAC